MPANLNVYNNQDPLNFTPEEQKQTDKLVANMIDSLSFFRIRLNDRPNMNDVHTHMSLFESYFTKLAPLVKYDSILTTEREKRFAEIKAANTEIHRLNQMLGNGISPESISAKLRDYDNIIRLWYGALGFQYASLKQYTPYGITYEFNAELQYYPDDGCSGQKEWKNLFFQAFTIITSDDTTWDIWRDTYHAELLDTDKNRQKISALLQENFPNHNIHEFRSRRNDAGSFSMRFTVNIPYTDIEAMAKHIIPDYQ